MATVLTPTGAQIWDKIELNLKDNDFLNSKSTASIVYVVRDAVDEAAACKAAWDFSPEFLNSTGDAIAGIPKQNASIEEKCGETIWKVKVSYEYDSTSYSSSSGNNEDDENTGNDKANGVSEVVFEVASSSTNVTRPIAQALVWRNSLAPKLENPAAIPIGWNGKLNAQAQYAGVEIPCAEAREEYTRRLSYSTVRSASWRRKMIALHNNVNKSKFKGWEAGEAQFLGVRYDTPQRGQKNVTCTFVFSIRPNEKNVKVGTVDIGTVRGHDYVWAVYDDSPVMVSNKTYLVRELKYIFVSQIFKYSDFGQLGL